MKIRYFDGGTLYCSIIEINGPDLIADDLYIMPLNDVDVIEDED